MMKKLILLVSALAVSLCLSACGQESSGIAVQRADQLSLAASAGERYAAMVVSEDVTDIQRDESKSVKELYVAVGDTVSTGDKLFSYDIEAMELDREKQLLEIEKMKNEQLSYNEQLAKLEQQLGRTYNEADKSRLTLEINTLKTSLLEIDYQLIAKEKSVAGLEEMLNNADVLSPVDGTVRSVNEDEGAGSYISIQREGAYKVKGSLNEMNINGGIMPGVRVRAFSRVEKGVYWEGTVESIDTDEPSQNQSDYWYGAADPMTGSSSYVFYVELDSVEGLLLGQHLYVEPAPAADKAGLWIPESFFSSFSTDDSGVMSAALWVADAEGRLGQRSVTLGLYDSTDSSYEIVAGLSPEEYVADPSDPGCLSGAKVSYREVSDFSGDMEEMP